MAIIILSTAWNQNPDIEVEVSQTAEDTYQVNYGTESRMLLASNLRDSTFDLVAWAESNFNGDESDFDCSDISSFDLVSPNATDPDMPALEPVTDSESDDSDDESVPDLLSVSDDLHEDTSQIGDLLAEGAKAHLEFLQPYPGDERVPVDDPRRDRARFQVSRVSDNDYLIWDEFFHELIVLPERLLREPNFELAAWYAARLGAQLGIPRSGKPKPIQRMPIDVVLPRLGSEPPPNLNRT
ncbi:hypothetical protein C8R46DRAFT_1037909 [Mycena filopes]|nr:hypothetical protein C8R46DRAFT_1037909 [Mycena filopes]